MDKNKFAITPPMGWNSYDYYDTTVTEEQVKANADYMAKHLKEYGWEYIVVDIEWYANDAGTQRDKHQYIPFGDLEMDAWSRLQPSPKRFPSSADGSGFLALAEYVHNLGLKFGIHIMRGIPRRAADQWYLVFHQDRHTLTEHGSIANMQICGVLPMISGIHGSFLRICSSAVRCGRIM